MIHFKLNTNWSMARNKIHKERLKIEAKIGEWETKLFKLRDICPHDALIKKYVSNTGHYDPSMDCYYTEFFCSDCGKRWTEEQ